MNEDIQKGRSPNSPKFDLGQAVELTKKLYEKIGRSSVKAEIAVGALGYGGINGAAMTTLGTLSQYGLVDRGDGNTQITPLALKVLHPVDSGQKASALREAALTPKVFADIHANWNDMAEDVLSNHLIHQRFTPETAKRTASVYKLNFAIANLGSASNNASVDEKAKATDSLSATILPPKPTPEAPTPPAITPKPTNVLATFKIPLGSSVAELVFTGERLEPDDFETLADHVSLFKKTYERMQARKALEANSEPPPTGAGNTTPA